MFLIYDPNPHTGYPWACRGANLPAAWQKDLRDAIPRAYESEGEARASMHPAESPCVQLVVSLDEAAAIEALRNL